MSNKDSIVIPPRGKVTSPKLVQPDAIILAEGIRQNVIVILRQAPAGLDFLKKLSEEKSYRLVIDPKFKQLMQDGSVRLADRANGLFGAWLLDAETGHIINHPSLEELPPDLLNSLNQAATQQTLADIVYRLEVIDKKIGEVLQGQINDRLAEVESGIKLYGQAMAAFDPDNRRSLLRGAVEILNMGRDKLIINADFGFIDELKRNRLGMLLSGHRDIPTYVQSKAESIWKAAIAIAKASQYLVLAYSALNEPGSLRVSLEQVQNEVKVFEDKIGIIINMLPPTSNWRESLVAISQGVLPNVRDLDDIPQKKIVIEFQPKEIAPPEGV